MDISSFRKKVIIGCFIILLTLLAGCNIQKNNREYYQKYKVQNFNISDIGDGLICGLSVQNGEIFFSFFSYADKSSQPLYHMDADGVVPKRVPLEDVIKDAYILDISYFSDEKRYTVSTDQERNIVHLNELNEKEQLVAQIDLGAVIPDYLNMPYTFKTDKNGLLYFIGIDRLYVLDEHGTLLFFQTYAGDFIHGYKDSANEVHIVKSTKNIDFMYDERRNKLVEKGKYKIPEFSDVALSIFDGSNEFSFYYIQESDKLGKEIYGVKNNTAFPLCNLSDTGIQTNSSTEFYALGKGKFLCKIQMENGNDALLLLEPYNQENQGSKQIITLAGIGISNEINSAANQFNLDNSDVQIRIVDYMDLYQNSYEEAYKNLNIHLLDKQIDILCLDNYDKRNLINKRMLEDLTTFWDKSENVKQSEILDCVLGNCKMEDGKIYSIFPQFHIRTFIKNGQGEDESIYEVLNVLDVNENQKLFLNSSADGLLYSLIKYNPEQLINYEDSTCAFDGVYFEKVLSILQSLDSYLLESDDIAEAVQNNEVKYLQMPINDIYDYILYLQMCDYKVEFIGYPTEEGMHPIMQPSSELGIMAASERKKSAWRFLEYLLEEEHYNDLFGGESFPIRNDSMENLLERMSATETYTKEDGTVIRAVDQYSIGINDYEIVPKALCRDDIAKFKNMLNSSIVCDGLSEKQTDIIWEEVELFLAGSQDKEITIRSIQSRISVTLQE